MRDLLLDVCFLLSGIGGTVVVLINRKSFDMWMSLPICMAWILKGVRYIYYDWIVAAADHMKADEVVRFIQNGHLTLTRMDTLVHCLLFMALVRLVIVGMFLRWYKKILETQNK